MYSRRLQTLAGKPALFGLSNERSYLAISLNLNLQIFETHRIRAEMCEMHAFQVKYNLKMHVKCINFEFPNYLQDSKWIYNLQGFAKSL